MACCGKVGPIVQGYTNLIIGKQCTATPRRRMVCDRCANKKSIWGAKYCGK